MDLEKLTLPLDVADKAFNAGIGAAVAGVTALVGAMGMAVKATFDWAGELDSIGDIMDTTNTEAAALNFTLRKSGTSTEAFTKGVTILSKGLIKADGSLDTTGKSLAAWGINVLDANGALKSQTDLIGEISDKYNTFSTQQEKVNFLTETFGKSGAELIDFFDVLASEGGIDTVAKKVEALGLAIDPARYEQFNRNLEELKMVGLGLAVGFTEKVMPALENFLGILSDPNMTLGEKVGALAASASEVVSGWWSTFKTAWDSINWDEVTAKITGWIDNVDFSSAGTKLAEMIDAAFSSSIDSHGWENVLGALGRGINEFFLSAVGADAFGGWKNYFTVWGEQIKTGFLTTVTNWKNGMAGFGLQAAQIVTSFFTNLTSIWVSHIKQWGMTVYNQVISYVNKIIAAFNSIPVVPNVTTLAPAVATNTSTSGRASGGPVIAGQTYNVAEFYRPERFTPAVSGRIDPMDDGGGDLMSNLTIIMQRFADEIARSNRAAFEKVGRR